MTIMRGARLCQGSCQGLSTKSANVTCLHRSQKPCVLCWSIPGLFERGEGEKASVSLGGGGSYFVLSSMNLVSSEMPIPS